MLTFGIAIALLAGLLGCGNATTPAPPPIQVVAAPPVQRDVPVYQEWVGTTVGNVNATIRPQVKGYLKARHYDEGAFVKQGDLLFEIDPREFQAQLDQALGELGEAQASLRKSDLDVERYTPLAAEGAVSQQELDDAVADRQRNRAAVAKAQAEVRQARLNLDWTRVTSPIDGVAGLAVAQIGDLVGGETVLTTVSQLDPIKVEFQLSGRDYLAFAERVSPDAIAHGKGKVDVLELILANGKTYPHRGTPSAVGRAVDPTTGTITLEGRFPNPGNLLRPGQFAKVRAVVASHPHALLVPQRAVMEVQGSHQIAIVGAKDTVEVRPVEVGPRFGEQWVIAKGLKPDERVVVEGTQKVRPGTVVAVHAPAATPPVATGPPRQP